MSNRIPATVHPVAARRERRGWTQETLATNAGIPRSSVSAIETGGLVPSVKAALAVARALECSVEELFAPDEPRGGSSLQWAWPARSEPCRYWEAQVGARRLMFPVEASPNSSLPHDGLFHGGVPHPRVEGVSEKTLVLAGCDPAAGLLGAEYAALSGYRLLTFSRGGSTALELLQRGLVHVAALHRSTSERPTRNEETVRDRLGRGFRLLRCADWEEGLALSAASPSRNVKTCARRIRRWALREPGSSARECLDELLPQRRSSSPVLLSHVAVAEAVRSGWAEAGVCVRLCAEDAGLHFLPIRTESLDLCFPTSIEHDPRVQALIRLLRSRSCRRLISELPGYGAAHTGELKTV